jgi:hypothetical protein
MGIFGWSYPPGAENDPYAPYNQEESPSLDTIKEVFRDYDGPGQLYRAVYKYTDCSPALGVTVRYWAEPEPGMDESGPASGGFGSEAFKTLYCDDLYSLGTWSDMEKRGETIHALILSSIVEGSDYEVPPIEIKGWEWSDGDPDDLERQFWQALEDVNYDACAAWDEANT